MSQRWRNCVRKAEQNYDTKVKRKQREITQCVYKPSRDRGTDSQRRMITTRIAPCTIVASAIVILYYSEQKTGGRVCSDLQVRSCVSLMFCGEGSWLGTQRRGVLRRSCLLDVCVRSQRLCLCMAVHTYLCVCV